MVVATGEKVTFSGTLTTLDGTPLVNKTIDIIENRASGPTVLVSAMTDANGAFSTTWVADLYDPANDRIMSVFASFNGEFPYTASKSGSVSIRVAVQDLRLTFSVDKQVYFAGEVATFTLKFTDPKGMPVDPESIRAVYDLTLVTLEKKGDGVYAYMSPPLTPPTHTLQVVAEKHGFKLLNDATTITVFARQTLPGVKLNLDWEPKQILQGMPVSFMLSFTDLNNVFTPVVNYTLTIKSGSTVLLDLPNQATSEGKATHTHTFDQSGKYRVTVSVSGIGQAPSAIKITQTFDYDVDVINPSIFSVKAKALQKGDAMRITFRNPSSAMVSVYSLQLKITDPVGVKIRMPPGWDVETGTDMITLKTADRPLEPGKSVMVRAVVEGLALDAIDWSAMDKDGNVLKDGSVKIIRIRSR
jgi:hypothetical protein